MRKILALAIVAALALPPAAAQDDTIVVPVAAGETTLDVNASAGKVLRFDASFEISAVIAGATLECNCSSGMERIELTMQNNGGTWQSSISVDHRHLVAGDWHVNATGTNSNGVSEKAGTHLLKVTVPDDDGAPRITVGGGQDLVKLGADETLRIYVNDTFLRQVTYQIEGMPFALPLPSPFALGVERFDTGLQNVTFTATDRTGNVSTKVVQVFADDVEPEIVADLPSVLYRDVPNPLRVRITEDSNFTLSAKVGSDTAHIDGEAGTRDMVLHITPTGAGGVLELSVIDDLLNIVTLRHDVAVRVLETDVRLHNVTVLAGTPMPGENRTIVLNADVLVSPVPVTVDVVHGSRVVGALTLNSTVSEYTLDVELPPGPNQEAFFLRVPSGVIELHPENQTEDLSIEFFIGRVLHGNNTYHIRVDSLARPLEAVGDNATYPLTAVDKDGATAYAFNVDGTDLYWDPFFPETEIPVAKDAPDSRNTPLPLGILLVALALALRRR